MTNFRSSPRLFYTVSFFGNLSIDLAIWSFYFTQVGGLSLATATAVHALIFLVTGLTDMPTGSLADTFGRRRIAIYGYVFRLLGVLLTLLAPTLTGLIFASVLSGLGWSLLSGSIEALLFDNLKSRGEEAEYPRVFANVMTFCFAARCLGFFVSSLLFAIDPVWPYALMALGILLAIASLGILKEAPYGQPIGRPGLKHIAVACRALFSAPIFAAILLPWMLIESWGEGIWISFQPLFSSSEAGILWTGALYSLGALASMYGSQIVKRVDMERDVSVVMLAYAIAMAIGALLLAWGDNLLIIALGVILPSIAWGMGYPLRSALINRAVASSQRATCLSCYSTTEMILASLVGMSIGVINEHGSPQFSMYCSAAVLLAMGGVVRSRLRRS